MQDKQIAIRRSTEEEGTASRVLAHKPVSLVKNPKITL